MALDHEAFSDASSEDTTASFSLSSSRDSFSKHLHAGGDFGGGTGGGAQAFSIMSRFFHSKMEMTGA